MYYAGGVTDPDYCVLRFTAVRGRFYGNFKSENFRIEEGLIFALFSEKRFHFRAARVY